MMADFHPPDRYRELYGTYGSEPGDRFGAFFIPTKPGQPPLKVIASDAEGEIQWEHVSVSLPTRTPTWEEMDRVKRLFWDDEVPVMQLHPPRSEWVSNHRYCLHLWRPVGVQIPLPPSIAVGYLGLGEFALK